MELTDKINSSFHSDALPMSMVNSFMESSNRSITIKGSEADFTVFSYEQKIYHFGGFGDNSIEYTKLEDPNNS